MKALIIAAGKGNRLNDLTRNKPKPLVKVLGLPLIERVILTAKQAGINEFVIVIGYLGDKIKAELGNGNKLGVKINYIENNEWEKGNGVSVLKAKNILNEEFFLFMSDHIFDEKILKKMIQEKIDNNEIMLAVDYNLSSQFVDVKDVTKVKVNNGKILDIGKEIKEYNAYDTGIFLCSPIIFEALEESIINSKYSLSDGGRILTKKGKVKAFDIKGSFWIDIDTKKDLKKAEQLISKISEG